MLRDQHGGRVGRQRHEHFADRFGAARRRADDDQLFGTEQRIVEVRRGRAAAAAGAAAAPRMLRRRGLAHAGAGGRANLVGELLRVVEHAVANADLRLGDEIDRAQFQRAQRDFVAALGQRRHHHDRHRPQAHQLLEEVEAVHARHFDVERQHVRVVLLDEFARDERVGRGRHDGHVRLAIDDFRHQAADQRRIVDAQYLDLLHSAHASSAVLALFELIGRGLAPNSSMRGLPAAGARR